MTISYVLIRVGGDGDQHYAGMFDSAAPDFQKRLEDARADPELHVVRLEHEGTILALSWAEVELAENPDAL